jgi:hypothetical protein
MSMPRSTLPAFFDNLAYHRRYARRSGLELGGGQHGIADVEQAARQKRLKPGGRGKGIAECWTQGAHAEAPCNRAGKTLDANSGRA